MSSRPTDYDAIIVGAGATGSWGARQLTEGGLNVLLLEAGGAGSQPRSAPESEGVCNGRQRVQSQCYAFTPDTRHLFVDDIDNPYETPSDKPFVWIRMRLVGGRTMLWHGVALRMSDRQFKAASRDGFGVDWPVCYADLEPHYDRIEDFLGVGGINSSLEEVPDGRLAPVELPAQVCDFKRVVEQKWPGRHVTALRRVGSSNEGRSRSPASTASDALADAQSTGRLTLQPHAITARLITDREGKRAHGVEYVDSQTGQAREVHAKVVILCASTIETTRILLNSVSRHHPDGLGNSNGLLGKYLTVHTSGVHLTALRAGECDGAVDFFMPNFRNLNGKREKFLRGYGIQGYIKPAPLAATTQCDLVSFGEMLPRAVNQVTVGTGKDRWGIPVPRISCGYSANELEMAADQAGQAEQMLRQAGFEVTERRGLSAPGCSIHEVGTARMGADPRTSTLNSYGQCWSVPNVFVTDGAAFPSMGFQNPTLTMMAVTGRACAYILRELNGCRRQPF